MAVKLFITPGSLRLHLTRLRKKLGVHSNRELLHILRKTPEHAMYTLRFTPRGREVFALIIEGLTSKGISERLGIGVNGIKRHKDKMLLQNDCETMRELIAKYYRADGCKDQTNE
ncbi:MAG: LuxR C-terminal-related transcriptional regulator [Desulfovibrio sp.]|nr:LuxR C-terminal-related transcriptional regulator [Desulfovibrio sp.]